MSRKLNISFISVIQCTCILRRALQPGHIRLDNNFVYIFSFCFVICAHLVDLNLVSSLNWIIELVVRLEFPSELNFEPNLEYWQIDVHLSKFRFINVSQLVCMYNDGLKSYHAIILKRNRFSTPSHYDCIFIYFIFIVNWVNWKWFDKIHIYICSYFRQGVVVSNFVQRSLINSMCTYTLQTVYQRRFSAKCVPKMWGSHVLRFPNSD